MYENKYITKINESKDVDLKKSKEVNIGVFGGRKVKEGNDVIIL